MRAPIFVRPLTDAEREQVAAGLRSTNAFTLRRCQILLASARGERATVIARLRGEHARVSPLPGPGVFATANSVAVPALLPDGSIAEESLSDIIESTPVVEVTAPPPDPRALTGGAPSQDGDR